VAVLLCLAFFLSGMAGLLFESLWFYQAGLGLGNSIWASSLVLAAFMGGLGVGNGLIGRFGHRVRAPIRLYALLEFAIGASGVGLVVLLPLLTPWLVPVLRAAFDSPVGLNALRVGVSFALLVAPAAAMGATMPLLVAALCRRDPGFGAALGRLYGWNTLGAVAGALIGELWLFEWVGIRGSAWVAASMNASAALLALALSRRVENGSAAPVEERLAGHTPALASVRVRILLGVAFFSGAALLALEVVWFRFLLLVATGTSRTFAIMLATVLAGIALGGLAGGRWLRRDAEAFRQLPALAALGGVLCIVSYAAFGSLPRSFEGRSALFAFEMLEIALPLMLPVSLVSGVLFTLLGEALHREAPGETRAAGLLTLANTLGAMLGSLLAGFVLLPGLGIERATLLLAAVYALLVALLWGAGVRPPAGARSWSLVGAVVGLCLAFGLFPHGLMLREYVQYPIRRFAPDWQPAEIREGLTETIVYLRRDLFGDPVAYRMLTNSHSMSSTIARDARYMKLFVYWPVAVHPDPRSALLISYGVGVTAKALTDTRSLEHIDFVDISRDVFEMNRHVYPDPNDNPLHDPRVTVHVEDGRFFLQTTDRRYDLITGEPPPPKLAGIVTLYTREYFELMRSRLAEGGIATYWLPVHNLLVSDAEAILAAFCAVFPDCTLWEGSGLDWMMAGTNGATGPVSAARFREQWEDPVVGPEMRALGFESPEAFGALFIEGSEALRARTRRVAPLTDDRPKRLSDLAMQEAPRFLSWLDGRRSRLEFRRDSTVARLWPRELIDSASAAFEDEVRFERSLARPLPIAQQMPQVHRFLTRQPRTTAPLWLLASGWPEVGAARRAAQRGEHGADLDYHLGVAALVERDFDGAALTLRRAASAAGVRPAAGYLEAYALTRAGRWDEARDLERALRANGQSADPAFDAFLRDLLRGGDR
jgi:predicted membrane-bound spermidine synthase